MSATDNFSRQVIPRWRRWVQTAQDNVEFPDSSVRFESNNQETSRLLQEFNESPSIGRASDLFSAAIFENALTPEISAIAQFMAPETQNWPSLDNMRAALSGGSNWCNKNQESSSDSNLHIHILKKNLVANPRNPVQWVDLAREYLIKGEIRKAKKAILSALEIAPYSRMVLRASATFFWELNELEQAIDILEKSNRTCAKNARHS